jgi:hypothetical protein
MSPRRTLSESCEQKPSKCSESNIVSHIVRVPWVSWGYPECILGVSRGSPGGPHQDPSPRTFPLGPAAARALRRTLGQAARLRLGMASDRFIVSRAIHYLEQPYCACDTEIIQAHTISEESREKRLRNDPESSVKRPSHDAIVRRESTHRLDRFWAALVTIPIWLWVSIAAPVGHRTAQLHRGIPRGDSPHRFRSDRWASDGRYGKESCRDLTRVRNRCKGSSDPRALGSGPRQTGRDGIGPGTVWPGTVGPSAIGPGIP